uniref:BTB domain-containing protein n=1 Tax=Angiostrongylus cantonensis TaxID=6313 RepID=A0A0K0CTY8_ANGCA
MDVQAVDGLEIIDFTKKGEVGELRKENQRDLHEMEQIFRTIVTGSDMEMNYILAYENCYQDGRSFDDLGGKQGSELLQFEFDFQVHRDGLKEMKTLGNTIHSNPMAVYHANVMWCYAYGLTVIKEENDDLLCLFEMISIGPSFSKKSKVVKGGLGNNCPPNQYPPEIKDIHLTLIGKSEVQIPLTRSDECFAAESLLPLSKLNIIMDNLPTLTMRVRLTIPSSYFLLDQLIDLNLKQPSTTPTAEKVLATILAGEKPPGYDWVITVADGSPREYFVHRKVLADASPTLESDVGVTKKKCQKWLSLRSHELVACKQRNFSTPINKIHLQIVFHTHMSLPSEQLLMVSHEDRFILASTHASDMRTILTYFYLRQFHLPHYDSIARVGRTLCSLLPQEKISTFFEYWQAEIVRDLLKLNVRFHGDSSGFRIQSNGRKLPA